MNRPSAILALTALVSLPATQTPAADRPNVVFIIADDLGYADCGFNGGTQIKTPHLDKLAGAGTVLESFYVQPLCSQRPAARG